MLKKILIFEDEPKNMKLLHDLLQRFGYEVIEAYDGEEGLELTKTSNPDLILMDIMIPKVNGLDATRIIKADDLTKKIPVVALTAFAMAGDKERAIDAGCNGYLSKPIDVKELLQTIKTYLEN